MNSKQLIILFCSILSIYPSQSTIVEQPDEICGGLTQDCCDNQHCDTDDLECLWDTHWGKYGYKCLKIQSRDISYFPTVEQPSTSPIQAPSTSPTPCGELGQSCCYSNSMSSCNDNFAQCNANICELNKSLLEMEIYSRGKSQDIIDNVYESYVMVSVPSGPGILGTYSQWKRGWYITVLDSIDGIIVKQDIFDTYGDHYYSTQESDKAVSFLNDIEPGQIILITTWNSVNEHIANPSKFILNILELWGCDVNGIAFRDSFAFIGYVISSTDIETIYCKKRTRYDLAIKQTGIKLIKLSLNIEIYSRGNNQDKIDGTLKSYVKVNGVSYGGDINHFYNHGKGWQIVVLNRNDGSFISKGVFNTYEDFRTGNREQSDLAVDFLNGIEYGEIVLITTYDSVDTNFKKQSDGILIILSEWGCDGIDLGHRESFVYIGYAQKETIYCQKSWRYGSAIKQSITL